MSHLHRLVPVLLLVLTLCAFSAARWTAPALGGAPQVPALPDPAPVSLDASTTAFLALDFNSSVCARSVPSCPGTLPAVAAAISAARAAGALVVYSTTPNATVLPDVLQQPDDPLVTSGADKFNSTNLDDILAQRGITTVVITGTVTNGAVLYTSFEAIARGYTVVVAEDGTSSGSDFAQYGTLWQLLNGGGTPNSQNTPLQPKTVTLSRTDLISYR